MKPEVILFYCFATLTVIPAIAILITNKVIYAAYLLLVSLLGIAALYVFAGADFLAVAQVMIYIGGVIVLLIFGIMLTARIKDSPTLIVVSKNTFVGILLAAAIFLVLLFTFLHGFVIRKETDAALPESTLKTVGKNLMTDYAFPFEAASLLILIALIGAVYIAGRQIIKKQS